MSVEMLTELKKHYDTVVSKYPENHLFYMGVYGSQNYGLDTPLSDVDTKAIVLPTKKQVILGKSPINTEVVVPETGALSTVKDIRSMFDNFYKGNINFVEILFTEWYYINPQYIGFGHALRNHREEIATRSIPNLFRMVQGMAKQKYIAMEKPFESKKEILEKYGYDPKQLHHIMRLYRFLCDFIKYDSFEAALHPHGEVSEILKRIKTDPPSLNVARIMREEYMGLIDGIIEDSDKFARPADVQKKRDTEVREFLDDLAYELISLDMGLALS